MPGAARGAGEGALLAAFVGAVVLRVVAGAGSAGRGFGVTGAGIVDTGARVDAGARVLDVVVVARGGAAAGVAARDGAGVTGAGLALADVGRVVGAVTGMVAGAVCGGGAGVFAATDPAPHWRP